MTHRSLVSAVQRHPLVRRHRPRAPVAKGASKLWQKVGKRPAADAPADVPMEAPAPA